MLKRIIAALLLTVLFVTPVSAETLSDFMFLAAKSWNAVGGEVSLLPIVNAEKIGHNRYQMHIQLKERGGIEAKVDKIIVHVFDNGFENEDDVRSSAIGTVSLAAMESVDLNEILEASEGQWVGYEFMVGKKSFLGICMCSGDETDNKPEDIEEEREGLINTDFEEMADEIITQVEEKNAEETENVELEEPKEAEEDAGQTEGLEAEGTDEVAEGMEAKAEEIEEPAETVELEGSIEDIEPEEYVGSMGND